MANSPSPTGQRELQHDADSVADDNAFNTIVDIARQAKNSMEFQRFVKMGFQEYMEVDMNDYCLWEAIHHD